MTISQTSIESFVSPGEFRDVVLAVEKYPEFLPEVKRVVVLSRGPNAMRATFDVALAFAGFDVKTSYTLDYDIGESRVAWKLAESPDLSKNEGEWRLEATRDGETLAHYRAELVTSLPIPEEVQKAFAEQQLPKLMEQFRDRAEG
jgi:ribosome-associated toxin RatA of RatAB toxin-antitoxin module